MRTELHPDFSFYLDLKEPKLIELFKDLRLFMLEINPEANELLYNTHALTSVFSISDKLSDAYCMLPIYTNHLNLGFHQGTLLGDPNRLLKGTGKLIRHIPVKEIKDYRNKDVELLVTDAIKLAKKDMMKLSQSKGETISKIRM